MVRASGAVSPQRPGDDYRLHLADVHKGYDERPVLECIDLAVRAGEICTLVGPSGSGKSTLLRLILGEEQPTRGRVSVDGQEVGFPSPERGIVFQRYSLYPHLRVLENLLLGRVLAEPWWRRHRVMREHHDEAMDYLERVRMADHAGKFPHQLSGGMQQRVAIAQSMILRPRILLMDEPFGALDPDTREDLQLFLLELWESWHMTLFFVTHDLEEALFMGTRILVLSQYWTDDRGDHHEIRRGARLVADHALTPVANAAQVKGDPRFRELMESIRRLGFDPGHLQRVDAFNLAHPDAFATGNQATADQPLADASRTQVVDSGGRS